VRPAFLTEGDGMATESKPATEATPKAVRTIGVKFSYVETRNGRGDLEVEAEDAESALAAAKAILKEEGDDEVLEQSSKFGSHRTKVKVTFDKPE
jgi:hypothetical protein